MARQGLGRDLAHRAASAGDPHKEVAEAVVELLDVSKHAHQQMMRVARRRRPCSAGERSGLYGAERGLGI